MICWTTRSKKLKGATEVPVDPLVLNNFVWPVFKHWTLLPGWWGSWVVLITLVYCAIMNAIEVARWQRGREVHYKALWFHCLLCQATVIKIADSKQRLKPFGFILPSLPHCLWIVWWLSSNGLCNSSLFISSIRPQQTFWKKTFDNSKVILILRFLDCWRWYKDN